MKHQVLSIGYKHEVSVADVILCNGCHSLPSIGFGQKGGFAQALMAIVKRSMVIVKKFFLAIIE